MTTIADIEALLTAPGAQFETVRETVAGNPVKVYKNRFRDLRTVATFGASHGEKEFIVYGERRITFGEFARLSNSVSSRLTADAGVHHGDRVAVLAQNSPEWCLSFWGTVQIGAILVGLNGWWTNDEILYGLDDSGATVLVADRKRFERIANDVDAISTLRYVYLTDARPTDFLRSDGTPSPKLRMFSDLCSSPSDVQPKTPLSENDPAVIFYTSGTTGRPKGAVSSHRSMIANLQNTVFLLTANGMLTAALAREAGEATPERGPSGVQPVSLFTSPLFHVSGCHSTLVVGYFGGLKLVMPQGRFQPETALQLIQDERITTWSTVPTMIWRTCEHPARHDYDTSSVTSVAFGGSPSAEELQRRIRETFPNVRGTSNAYGLTETSSVATALSGPDALTRADSVGRPVPTVELAIDGALDGEHHFTGEVLIRGPILMSEYWNKPEATANALRNGWLHTGDIGHLDEDGYLYITDRAKDMIIRGGENIYCVEIENRLIEHPSVADAAVIGIADPTMGEEVKALIELAPDAELDVAELQRWTAETLAAFKVPSIIENWGGKLPRNASGKLLKNVLRGEGDVSLQETM